MGPRQDGPTLLDCGEPSGVFKRRYAGSSRGINTHNRNPLRIAHGHEVMEFLRKICGSTRGAEGRGLEDNESGLALVNLRSYIIDSIDRHKERSGIASSEKLLRNPLP